MNTSAWGKVCWRSLFFIAAGYDLNESPKRVKDPQYKQYFRSVGHVLPCRYCRESYEKFYRSMDIQRYMDMPTCGLIRYVYDMKNLVNAKLLAQESKALQDEYNNLLQTKSPDDPQFQQAMQAAKARICYTKPAPPFDDVVSELMQHRASCSPELKTCRAPLKGTTPSPPQMPELDRYPTSDANMYRRGGGRISSRGRRGSSSRRGSVRRLSRRTRSRSRRRRN